MGWSLLFQYLLFNYKMTKAPPFCTFQNMQTSNFPCRNITLSMVTGQYFEAKTTTGLCTQDAHIHTFWLHCITSHILIFTVNLTIKMSQIHFKHCSQDMKANSQHAAGCDSFSLGAEKGPGHHDSPSIVPIGVQIGTHQVTNRLLRALFALGEKAAPSRIKSPKVQFLAV